MPSHILALLLEEPDEVYLIGMDLNSTMTGKVNNIFVSTPNYVLKDSRSYTKCKLGTAIKRDIF